MKTTSALSKKPLNKNGVSLIEMLITVAIFMVVITGVIRLIPYTLKFQNLSHSQQSERNFRVLLASLNKEACNKTFEGKTVGERVDVIKDESGIILFNRGENGGEFQKNLRIVEIKTRALSDEDNPGSAEMVVSYKRTQSLYPTKTGEDGDCTAGGSGDSSVTTGCYTLTCGLRIKKDGALVGAGEGQQIVSDGGRGCSIIDCGGTEGMGGGKPDCYKVTEEGEGGLTLVGCEGAAEAENIPPKNTVFGFRAGKSLTTSSNSNHGTRNTFIGYEAGMNNTTGFYNNFVGYGAGLNNDTGFHNNFVGYQAGLENRSGYHNNFVGYQAGLNNTTGIRNNFLGVAAGEKNTTGDFNNFIGHRAGHSNTTGSYNIYIGTEVGGTSTKDYQLNIGDLITGTLPKNRFDTLLNSNSQPQVTIKGNTVNLYVESTTAVNICNSDGSECSPVCTPKNLLCACPPRHRWCDPQSACISEQTRCCPSGQTKCTSGAYSGQCRSNCQTTTNPCGAGRYRCTSGYYEGQCRSSCPTCPPGQTYFSGSGKGSGGSGCRNISSGGGNRGGKAGN